MVERILEQEADGTGQGPLDGAIGAGEEWALLGAWCVLSSSGRKVG